jgi:hypothetical protein
MNAIFFTLCLVVAPPSPGPTGDTVTGIYYGPQPVMTGLAVSLCTSAESAIKIATWKLTDGTLAAALCFASSRGVRVGVALELTGGTGTLQSQLARQIVASGGTVWSCVFPHQIANNFVTADGSSTILGNYYWSPTAAQIGTYLVTVSGTNAATQSATTFATLIASGTVTTDFVPTLPRLREAPTEEKHVNHTPHRARRGIDAYAQNLLRDFLQTRRKCKFHDLPPQPATRRNDDLPAARPRLLMLKWKSFHRRK